MSNHQGLAAVLVILQLLWVVPAGAWAMPGVGVAVPVAAARSEATTVPVWALARRLHESLGDAPEWELLTEPTVDPLAGAEAALAARFRRDYPGSGPLVLDALPGYLARRILPEIGLWDQQRFVEEIRRDLQLVEAYADVALQVTALDPSPGADLAALWLAQGRLFWFALDHALTEIGQADLLTALGRGASPPAAADLARQLSAPIPGFYDRYAADPGGGPILEPPAAAWLPREAGAAAVYFDGGWLDLTPPPVIQNGLVLVPLRAFTGRFGAAVEWNEQGGAVGVTYNDRRLEIAAGGRAATLTVGQERYRLLVAVPAQIEQDTMYVTLEIAAAAVGLKARWDAKSRTIFLGPGGPSPPLPPILPPDLTKTIYLTFDDGPDAKLTPRVLDLLAARGVPATFFVVGENASRHPELLRRMLNEGHAVGTHSWDHNYANIYMQPPDFVGSLERAAAVISGATGTKVFLARAPGGTGNAALRSRGDAGEFWAAAARAGYTLYDWHIDSGDSLWPRLPAKEVLARVQSGAKARGTGPLIVLFHDATSHEETVAALPEVINWFTEQGYAFAPLPVPPP